MTSFSYKTFQIKHCVHPVTWQVLGQLFPSVQYLVHIHLSLILEKALILVCELHI